MTMGRIFRPYYTKAATTTAEDGVLRCRVTVECWYVEYYDSQGKQKREKGYKDKASTLQLLAQREREASQAKHGLRPSHNHADRTLAELQKEYLETLQARGGSATYLRTIKDHLNAVLPGCRFFTVHDFDADRLIRWLSQKTMGGGVKSKHAKPSPATLNSYLRTVKGFAKWCQKKTGVLIDLSEAKRFHEKGFRRRSKRILTEAEFERLLAATEKCPRRHGMIIPGRDRAMLYRIAAYTGLRASELASLTPRSFDLEAATVVIEAIDEKAGRGEIIPLPDNLVVLLRPWLKGRKPMERLWPGTWAETRKQSDWLARDVKRAKIDKHDDQGRNVTFHSLRRRFVSGLFRNGGDIAQVKRLSRHKELSTTLEYYEESDMKDLRALVNKLEPQAKDENTSQAKDKET
jgi:integrase/recombinase XerD